MNIYPYRTIKSGEFTKYLISIAENGNVIVEHKFKNKCKAQLEFASQKEVDESKLPKIIKVSARWALMIAHPPCTYLSNSGVSWLYKQEDRWKNMIDGAVFFRKLFESNIPMIAVENPVMHKYAKSIIGYEQSQVIQPWMFGHMEQKATCLWLKNLPLLRSTNDVKDEMMKLPKNERERLHYLPPSEDRWKLRSKTFDGIAEAMAEQWV